MISLGSYQAVEKLFLSFRAKREISTVNKKGDFSVAALLRNDIFVHLHLSEGPTLLKVASK